MPGRRRIVFLGIVALVLLPFLADYAWARARLRDVSIEVSIEPQQLTADGQQSATLTLRVTENGEPRAGDLVQSWITVGNGLLTPQWVYTDQSGMAQIRFTPNAMTRYEVQDRAEIHVKDINIGRLIEVGKELTVVIPLVIAVEDEQKQDVMTFGQ